MSSQLFFRELEESKSYNMNVINRYKKKGATSC